MTAITGALTQSIAPTGHYVRHGVLAGVAAGVANAVAAAAASAADVSMRVPGDGEEIPVLGFAQATVVAAAVGVVIPAIARQLAC